MGSLRAESLDFAEGGAAELHCRVGGENRIAAVSSPPSRRCRQRLGSFSFRVLRAAFEVVVLDGSQLGCLPGQCLAQWAQTLGLEGVRQSEHGG